MNALEIRVLRPETDGVPLPLVEGPGLMQALVWPGMGARHRSMHRIALGRDGRTALLRHPRSEAVYYVVRGTGAVVDEALGERHPIREGMMFHVTAGTPYRLAADGRDLVCVGGPCPPDADLYYGGT